MKYLKIQRQKWNNNSYRYFVFCDKEGKYILYNENEPLKKEENYIEFLKEYNPFKKYNYTKLRVISSEELKAKNYKL